METLYALPGHQFVAVVSQITSESKSLYSLTLQIPFYVYPGYSISSIVTVTQFLECLLAYLPTSRRELFAEEVHANRRSTRVIESVGDETLKDGRFAGCNYIFIFLNYEYSL